MSVLLFMPTSGGSPLESIILTSHEEAQGDVVGSSDTQEGTTNSNYHHRSQVVSRFDMENGIPVRKLSCDSAASWSEDEQEEGLNTRPGESVPESTSGTTSTNHIYDRKMPPDRSYSTGSTSKASPSSSSSSRGRWNVNGRLSRSTSPLPHRVGERENRSTIDVHNGILV